MRSLSASYLFSASTFSFFRSTTLQKSGRLFRSMKQWALLESPSWVEKLKEDPEGHQHEPNQSSREVRRGHYVLVRPTPLIQPKMVIVNTKFAHEVGFTDDLIESDDFTSFFSGHSSSMKSWATPYALSIMGVSQRGNCPFGTGNGYGDGRAISVAEILTKSGQRFEFQLKGAGTTPFCRGADGRAVLRSSMREFLGQEAMHNLGVATTRSLSLIVDELQTVNRGWYTERHLPSDIRLCSPERQVMVRGAMGQMDNVIQENCAITCRVAPSFLRIGHIELHGKRASEDNSFLKDLELIVDHAWEREFEGLDHALWPDDNISKAAALWYCACDAITSLSVDWIRVGFCQGNFNSDNCLVSGRTMDYGPFGFVDRYDPLFAKWNGSGAHFGFLNQPQAAIANLLSLKRALMPLLREGELDDASEYAERMVKRKYNRMARLKLGFKIHDLEDDEHENQRTSKLFDDLLGIMYDLSADYTMFFRELGKLLAKLNEITDRDSNRLEELLKLLLEKTFYEEPTSEQWTKLSLWVDTWMKALTKQKDFNFYEAVKVMNRSNPKYVLREHVLVDAYQSAQLHGDFRLIHELFDLIQKPYDEQNDDNNYEDKYFKLAPTDSLTKLGIATFS